jgi:hypothetical protein
MRTTAAAALTVAAACLFAPVAPQDPAPAQQKAAVERGNTGAS